jgi:cytochrome c oxidase subunit 3
MRHVNGWTNRWAGRLSRHRRRPVAGAVLLLLGLVLTYIMGAVFIAGQAFEYAELVHQGITIPGSAYGTVFYLATGFHGLHVTGGLVAFLFVLGRTFVARKFTHEQAVTAIVVSYYWHFVDVVWIALFATVYLIK